MSVGAVSAISPVSGVDRIAAITALSAQDEAQYSGPALALLARMGNGTAGFSAAQGPSFNDVASYWMQQMDGAKAGSALASPGLATSTGASTGKSDAASKRFGAAVDMMGSAVSTASAPAVAKSMQADRSGQISGQSPVGQGGFTGLAPGGRMPVPFEGLRSSSVEGAGASQLRGNDDPSGVQATRRMAAQTSAATMGDHRF